MDKKEMHILCKQHIHRYVGVQMSDGSYHDGIVEMVDDDYLYLAVPIGGIEAEANRGIPPYFGAPYGYPYPYPYPGYVYPRRRFARQVLPLAGLVALSLLPYI